MMETIQRAIVSGLTNAGGSSSSAGGGTSATGPAADGTPTASFVSRILQVALGLFVSSVDLPSLSPELQASSALTFDCDFSMPCRWSSLGGTQNRWKLAKGEPDSILWLAATGTMVQPAEPFALLEARDGRLGDMLGSDLLNCQEGSSLFSFTYWTIGNSDLEICLLDADFNRFNCTGMLQTQVQPGKVALRIPPVQQSFHIAIIPNADQGILVLDDIKYDARYCQDRHRGILLSTRSTQQVPRSSTPLPWWSSSPSSSSSAPGNPLFTSPVPVPGPISTASPLPNPISIGPSLPMGPMILPPLLPGPPAGILNPFVVAPLIPMPATSTFASFTQPSPLPSAPSQIPRSSATPLAIIVTASGTSTDGPDEEEEGEEEEDGDNIEMEKLIAAMGKSTTTERHIFTSTIIAPRTRSRRPPPPEGTRETRAPTGIPNIKIAPSTTTVKPLASFELLIIGNKTRPFFDRRLGKITEETGDLLCDFANNFPCLWGAEAGRWAIVEKGAIPSLDEEVASSSEEDAEAPSYPAAVVIQGTAMLSSDPLRCQSGEGKLLFRYWTNGRVLVQVCAMGWAVDSAKIQCVEEVAEHNRMDPSSLAIFELPDPIREPFTLNLVPIWEKNAQNHFLLIDEIAYIGECNLTALNEIDEEESREISIGRGIKVPGPGTGGHGHGKRPSTHRPATFIPPHFTIRPRTSTPSTTPSSTTSPAPLPLPMVIPVMTVFPPLVPITLPSSTISSSSASTTIARTPSSTATIATETEEVDGERIFRTKCPSKKMGPLPTLWPPPVRPVTAPAPPPALPAPPNPPPQLPPTSTRRPRPRTRRPLVINPVTSPPGPELPQTPAPVPIWPNPPESSPASPPPPPSPRPRSTNRPFPTRPPRPQPFIEETANWLSSSRRPGTRYPFYPSTPTPSHQSSTPPWGPSGELPTAPIDWISTKSPKAGSWEEEEEQSTIYPGIEPLKKKRPSPDTTKNSFTIPYTTTQRYKPTTAPIELNYCKLLNCDFNENACHYLNHGLTRVPWTLRTKGYGFPLNRNTDLRPTPANGQFVSSVLGPGDFAILESPRFNLTDGINVLLFQYYRPTHSSTIRLCLGTRYTKPLRTVSAFLQCPPILRSVTSKSTAKWNSVHIQLPPGTSHFYLVAHNLDRSAEKTAIGIDNIRVAICDPRATYDPEDPDLVEAEPRMIVPSVGRRTDREGEEGAGLDSKELYEDLTDVNEEDDERK